MNENHQKDHLDQIEEPPPVLKSWNRLYLFVIVFQVVLVLLFYFITKTYS